MKWSSVVQRRQSRRRRRRSAAERLEHTNVEDIVNAGTFRKTQAVGDRPDALDHLERPGEARAKLAAWTRQERLRRPMQDAQPHPVIDGEL